MNEEVKVDARIVEMLKKKIIMEVSRNLRTKNFSDPQMVKKIKEMIEENVRCCSNQ